jgi:Tfp pilus assembly protein PilF
VDALVTDEPIPDPESARIASEETPSADEQPQRRTGRWMGMLRFALLAAIVILIAVFWDSMLVLYRQSRARMMLGERHDRAALQPLRSALRRDLTNPETLLLLARAHRRLGDLPKVKLLLDHAETCGGEESRIERERWLVLAQSGRTREVESHLPEMLMDPGEDGPDICQAFVQGYFSNLRSGDAVQLLDVWEESFPEDPQVYFMRAYLMQSVDDADMAEKLYRKGLKLAPGQVKMRKRLADVLRESGQWEKAEKELNQCLTHVPEDPDVWFALAQCSYERGETGVAMEQLGRTLEADPDHFEARRLKGQLLLAGEEYESARTELEAVVAARPYDLLAREALARALRSLGLLEAAQRHFDYVIAGQKAVERTNRLVRESMANPADAAIRFEIGSIMMQYGSPDDAARWMRAVLQLEPNHVGAHRALANYCEQQGDAAGATFHRRMASAGERQP